jgi:hypothetical protein
VILKVNPPFFGGFLGAMDLNTELKEMLNGGNLTHVDMQLLRLKTGNR